ncbi:MAG TPA: SPFH domain-containing protein [Caulobacter sp.]|nr:SPFH domain-containing protein [Caulobacter sp.]
MPNGWWIALGAVVVALVGVSVLARRRPEVVYEWDWALQYIDGRFVRILPPGRYWPPLWRDSKIVKLIKTVRVSAAGGVDVMTSDRFSARLSVSVVYRIVDPVAAQEGAAEARLTLMLSDALVRLASARTLDDLLAERGELGAMAVEAVAPAFPELALEGALISNLTLPPELRKLLTAADMARMEGQAALERARAEQASLRSLANAARMLKDNPELMRLRTLQAVSPTGKGATLVLGADPIVGAPGG